MEYLNIESCHLLGQSWGGMLAIAYAIEKKNAKLKSLILSSTLSSASLWAKEQHRMIGFMSDDKWLMIVDFAKEEIEKLHG